MVELTKANPDIETLKTLIWLSGLLIGILLVIVSYFLSKQIQISETLTKAVNSLTTAVTVLESQNKDRYPVIEKRLDDHGRRLDEHSEKLSTIQTKCMYYHSER